MKKFILFVLILFSVISLHAEAYEVVIVIGNVSYEKAGKWKFVKAGDKISDEVKFKIGENSSVTFSVNDKRIILRGPRESILADLLKERKSAKKPSTNTSIKKGSTASTTKNASKGVSTASSRASESQGAAILDEE